MHLGTDIPRLNPVGSIPREFWTGTRNVENYQLKIVGKWCLKVPACKWMHDGPREKVGLIKHAVCRQF